MNDYKTDEKEKKRKKRNQMKVEIQRLYEVNATHFDKSSEQYGQLMIAVEQYATPAIWTILKNSPFSTREDYEAVLMIGRKSFLSETNNVFFNYSKENKARGMFADYARGMYKNKATDHIKKRYKDREIDPVLEDVYIERAFDDMIPSVAEVLVEHYTKAVMNSDAHPFHIIFLCYSKILPVVLEETRCNSADGWAWEHMQGKTMFRLSDLFVRNFNSAMRKIRIAFGKAYCDKLEASFEDDKTGRLYEKLGEVILTSLYEQSNTKNWVARLNKKIMITVVSELMYRADSDEDVKRVIAASVAYTGRKYC